MKNIVEVKDLTIDFEIRNGSFRAVDKISFDIKNNKICDLDLTQFNSEKTKYTTLQRSTLIEFLKDDVYTQHLRFGKKIKEVSELKGKVLIKFDD